VIRSVTSRLLSLPALAALCVVITLVSTPAFAGDPPVIKNPSPDGRFALRVSDAKEDGATPTIEIIEKKTGKVVNELSTSYFGNREDILLVWSADSKRAAFATRGPKQGDVSAYFWNATTSKFDYAEIPDDKLPDPDTNFGKDKDGPVKNYGGAPKPLRWLKSGDLLMSNDSVMMSRNSGKTYTGTVTFTVSFDKDRHATIHGVSKTRTKVD